MEQGEEAWHLPAVPAEPSVAEAADSPRRVAMTGDRLDACISDACTGASTTPSRPIWKPRMMNLPLSVSRVGEAFEEPPSEDRVCDRVSGSNVRPRRSRSAIARWPGDGRTGRERPTSGVHDHNQR